MQSVESTSLHASSDWPSSGEDDSEVFLPEEESSEITRGHSRSSSSSLSSSSSSQLGWCSTESEGEKERAGGNRGDLLFAQKCLELQGFVRPLFELLTGLKKGRFDKGLSSFQQSVAMDRIQRIMGLLQKPHIGPEMYWHPLQAIPASNPKKRTIGGDAAGFISPVVHSTGQVSPSDSRETTSEIATLTRRNIERYLPTLLQVEMMLKHWFPQVSPRPEGNGASTRHLGQKLSPNSSSIPIHKHNDQLHIPVKKRRLSWSDTNSSTTPPPVPHKRYHVNEKEKEIPSVSVRPALAPQPDQPELEKIEPSGSKALCCSEPSLTRLHIPPLVSPHKSSPSNKILANESKQDRNTNVLLTLPSPSSMGSPATQDSAVSSTTPSSEPAANLSHQEKTSQTEERSLSSVITKPLLT